MTQLSGNQSSWMSASQVSLSLKLAFVQILQIIVTFDVQLS